MNSPNCNTLLAAQDSSPIFILAHPQPGPGRERNVYHIAGQCVVSDLNTEWLDPFLVEDASLAAHRSPHRNPAAAGFDGPTVFAGEDTFGDRRTPVTCQLGTEGYCVHMGGVGEFAVRTDGSVVACLRKHEQTSNDALTIALLGAPFLLALALRQTWALHASALHARGGVVAFAGESGLGKSTLARVLDSGGVLKRVGDDVLPVSLHKGRMLVHAGYPQFKLPADGQPPAARVEKDLPLSALFVLARPPDDASGVQVTRLSSADSAFAIAANTVAARLFGRSLLAQHLAFCSAASAAVPVYSLSYPRRLEVLPAVQAAIEQVLG